VYFQFSRRFLGGATVDRGGRKCTNAFERTWVRLMAEVHHEMAAAS